jgi:pimeloyl-ACP methyl ester carboxylesterase
MISVSSLKPVTPPRRSDEPGYLEHKGCRIAYRVRGDGEPVLFIQGVATQGDAWAPQIDDLSDAYACASFDNRGLGRSQPVGAPVTVPQMAEDARVLLDALGWGSAHVVGHSLGGPIAMALALAAPARVRSLSLLCTFANGLDATKLTAYMFWWGLRTRIGTRRQRRHAFLQLVVPPAVLAAGNPDALAEELGAVFGRDLADTPPIVGQQMSAMRSHDVTGRLRKLARVPTLVVSARHDPIARPELGRALAAGIPGATYVELEDASHAVTVQQPERVNGLLRTHFGAADGRAVRAG